MTGVAEAPAVRASTRRSPRQWFVEQDNRELALWGALFVLTVIAHVIGLGNRPFHHDESQDAYFSYIFRQTGVYEYNPLLHGPLRFYLTALMYVLFGDSNFTARLAPVLMALAMIPMCWGLRRQLGRGGAFMAAVLLAFEPTYLYFGRFAREDIYFASLTLALIVVILRFLDRPRKYHPALIGAVLALSFSTKETTFITVFVMGTFFLFMLALPPMRMKIWGPVRAVGLESWGWALAAFLAIFTVLFTTFLTHPHGLWDGVYTGLKYWTSQQGVHRGGEPKGFYLVMLWALEWPTVFLGVVGAVSLWRRNMLVSAFLIWDFVLSLAVYSWAGEKFAWLLMHPLLPLILLAGAGVQAIWQARGPARYVGLAATAIGLFYLGISSWWVNVERPANPREFLVSTQSSEQVKQVTDRVEALARSRPPGSAPLTITVDAGEGATFPYAWYFRHLSAGYIDLEQPNAQPPATDVVLMTETSRARLNAAMGAYNQNRYDFRVWWVRDYSGVWSLKNWWNYWTKRQVWNPTGGMPEYIYVKKGL